MVLRQFEMQMAGKLEVVRTLGLQLVRLLILEVVRIGKLLVVLWLEPDH